MRRIERYSIPIDGAPHDFQLSHNPLAVGIGQMVHEVDFWAENDDEVEGYTVRLQVVSSWETLPDHALWVGTCQAQNLVVWHVVQLPVEPKDLEPIGEQP